MWYTGSMKTITINFEEESKKVEILLSTPMTYTDFTMLLLNSIITFANKVLESAPEEHKTAIKGELYDVLNIGTSNALAVFAPELEIKHTSDEEQVLSEMEDFVNAEEHGQKD